MELTDTTSQEEVCPRCGGTDFHYDGEVTEEGKFNISTCRNCQYQIKDPVYW